MGNIKIESLFIETTQDERQIRILLPDNYQNSKIRYPVLYMHDGQNLFDDETSAAGQSWNINDTLKILLEKNIIRDIIVVGIDNSNLRLFEYSPWESSELVKYISEVPVGGLGDIYAQFVVEKVKPYIDKNYRTKKDYHHAMIAGSSMGAYISAYIAIKYPGVFQHVGIFSLASWFNEGDFLKFINSSTIDTNQRFFISIGSNESSREATTDFNEIYLQNSRNLLSILKNKKVKDILYIETDDIHHESAWKKVFVDFIRFAHQKS
ncbi:MAG: alpha/beta hydrolase [Firmicutes bacterium]|nr:alpha/beta hydrolase [Bacillota bacterium]